MEKAKQASMTPMGFVAGLAVGAILAMLYTPKSGNEMRKTIRESSDQVKSNFKEKAKNIGESINEEVENTAKDVQRTAKRRNERMNQTTPNDPL